LETGKLVPTPDINEIAAFPRWEIKLDDNTAISGKRSEPIYALDLSRAAKV